jgi:Leucine-rich repeat (LRR) protein
LALAIIPGVPLTAHAAPGDYNPGDIAVINDLIDNNGLNLPECPYVNGDVSPTWMRNNWPGVTWTNTSGAGARIIELNIPGGSLQGVLELNNLSNLIRLDCHGSGFEDVGHISELKISNLINLEYLNCFGNDITNLELSNLSNLVTLHCGNNNLTSLNTTGCISLELLDISNDYDSGLLGFNKNNITSLDLSNNSALKLLACSRNQLATLDVSNNSNLERLYIDTNMISTLDLSNNPALTWLECGVNYVKVIDLTGTNVSQATFNNLESVQKPTALTLPANTSFTCPVNFSLGTTFDNPAISYDAASGLLKSTDSNVSTVLYETPTGIPGCTIYGSLILNYVTETPSLQGTVTIAGTAKPGETLSADTSKLSSEPKVELGALVYQWYRSGVAITSATAATYVVADDDIDKELTVTVTAANCTGSITSPAVVPTANSNYNNDDDTSSSGSSENNTSNTNTGNTNTGSTTTNPAATPATGDTVGSSAQPVIWLLIALGSLCLIAGLRYRRQREL